MDDSIESLRADVAALHTFVISLLAALPLDMRNRLGSEFRLMRGVTEGGIRDDWGDATAAHYREAITRIECKWPYRRDQ